MDDLDHWLSDAFTSWAKLERERRISELQEMLEVAKQAGMIVETDFAVFCRLLVTANGDSDCHPVAVLEPSQISDMLATDWKPAAKLIRLERMLMEAVQVPG